MKPVDSSRRYVIVAIMMVISLIFAGRLFYLQVIDKSYKASAESNALRYYTDYPARGLIYDRNGEELVYNEATYDLMVIPNQLSKDFDTASFCMLIGVERNDLRSRLKAAVKYSRYLPSIVDEKIPKAKYGRIQEKLADYPGFFVQARTIRNYPQAVAAHILGYIGEVSPEKIREDKYYRPGDYIGISGLEHSYEKELRGRKGVRIMMVDVHGRDKGSYLDGKFDVEARAGQNLYTYIDMELQLLAEALLSGKRGAVVAIDPETGGILTMATSPTYDPNLLVGRERAKNYYMLLMDKELPLFNRALTGKYPPGSTFKTVVGLVGLKEGAMTTSSAFPCFGGFPLGNGKQVGCHPHFSPINFEPAIQTSCNAYFCRTLKNTLELKKFGSTAKAFTAWRNDVLSFGLGQKLGVDLPNESSGNIPTPGYYDKIFGSGRWRALSIISIAIGQGEIQLTPLQLANLAAIIANRGWFYTPHVVKAIGNPANLNPAYSGKRQTNISESYFIPLVSGMYGVVEAGTARNVRLDSIKVAGKTGTVQNAGKNHSVFMAFAPLDHPKIAIAAVIENSGYGATWAAPVASLLIEYYLTRKIKRTDLEKSMRETKLIQQ
jgi:penicillin-binding protein 2